MLRFDSSDFLPIHDRKRIFTAGPASLLAENITNLSSCFGRGDADYEEVRADVINSLNQISGQKYTVEVQGSGTLAIEIMIVNFIHGKILLLDTGYYSDRLKNIVNSWKNDLNVNLLTLIKPSEIEEHSGDYDFVLSCPTETSNGLLTPISELRKLADKTGAKLALDATASIGLEDGHQLADVLCYSSCKGLFGLTGASFVSYKAPPKKYFAKSFYLNLETHRNRGVTGPYHTIQSLQKTLQNHNVYRNRVRIGRDYFLQRFHADLSLGEHEQPLLCTALNKTILAKNQNVILYQPRVSQFSSIVCHIGVIHLEEDQIENFYDENLDVVN